MILPFPSRPYEPGTEGICPHCLTGVRFIESQATADAKAFDSTLFFPARTTEGLTEVLVLVHSQCPSCKKTILHLIRTTQRSSSIEIGLREPDDEGILLWPRQTSRKVPKQVPQEIAADFLEAAALVSTSEKASAAMSRRCLQAVLSDPKAGGSKKRALSEQIADVLPNLPSYVSKDLDSVREIGNFAAHPTKDIQTGEIIAVQQGEAEWNLSVLEELFDHYYVKPAVSETNRLALNEKLKKAGRRPLTP